MTVHVGRCRPRAMSICTRLVLQAMRNSPATQAISSREVVIVCTRWPVAGSVFSDIAVRLERWKAGVVAFISVVLLGCDSAMDQSSFFSRFF